MIKLTIKLPSKLFAFFIVIFIACHDQNEKNLEDLNLNPNQLIKIEFEDNATNNWLFHQSIQLKKEEPYLIFQNPFPTDPNLLFLTAFGDEAKNITLKFENEGPDGVGYITDFYFHNTDSIFLIDRYSYRMSLVDSAGKMKETYRIKKTDGNRPDASSSLPFTLKGRGIIFKDNSILIPTIPDVDPHDTNYSNKNLMIKINLLTKSFEYLLGYPSSFKDGFLGGPDHFLPSISEYKNHWELLISYPTSDSVFIFDLNENTLRPFFVSESELVKNTIKANPQKWQEEDRRTHQLAASRHSEIIFDQYRDKIYRFSMQGFDDDSIDKILSGETGNPRKVSLNYHDSKGRLLGKFYIDANHYDPSDILVLKKGVYLGEISSKSENEKTFHKIEFD